MQMEIYEVPKLSVMPVHWAKWPKLAARLDIPAFSLPWAKVVREEFNTSKSIVVDAPIGAVWKVVSNPANAAHYLDSIISVEQKKDNLYTIKEVASPKLNRSWELIEYQMEVLERVEEKSHVFRIHFDENKSEEFGYHLEPDGDKRTIITYITKTNFPVSNYQEIGKLTDHMLLKIGRIAIGEQAFKKSLERE